MTRIHSTAVVDPRAELADDVEVGPYSIIGAGVCIGSATRVAAHVVLDGHTTIGSHNLIAPFCSLGGPPQDKKYAGEPTSLQIGDRNVIREYCYFNTGTVQDAGVTRIGDDNWIMGYVHVAHDCQVGNNVTLANSVQLGGHVRVGDWAIIGGLCGVHQFVRVGAHVMVGAHSYLSQDVPPYVLCSGNPTAPYGLNSEGLRRRDFTPASIALLRQAYKLLYRSGLKLDAAKEAIAALARDAGQNDNPLQLLVDFVQSAERGIIR
ncbi:MAG: acyl-ACP--UDP-N-acetylglucosamine O-acyltransferase [Burkholderiaceae bacterium]|jgi:UDP-N-acetylglucosamine acyltransferase